MTLTKVNYQIPGKSKTFTAFFNHASINEAIAASPKIAAATIISSETQEAEIDQDFYFDETGELRLHSVESPELADEYHEKLEEANASGDISQVMKLSGIKDWY